MLSRVSHGCQGEAMTTYGCFPRSRSPIWACCSRGVLRRALLDLSGRTRLRPIIYSLALGVYCTTWTFFGAVGTAATQGWAYLPIYFGPALVFIAGRGFLERLIRIARAHNITSISDLVSARFGKSPEVAAVIALMALTAGLPYLALQYKAVAAVSRLSRGHPMRSVRGIGIQRCTLRC